MSDAYASVHIPKSLPIHGMALTSTGRKIEHSKVVVVTQTFESISLISLRLSVGLYKYYAWSLNCFTLGVLIVLHLNNAICHHLHEVLEPFIKFYHIL